MLRYFLKKSMWLADYFFNQTQYNGYFSVAVLISCASELIYSTSYIIVQFSGTHKVLRKSIVIAYVADTVIYNILAF